MNYGSALVAIMRCICVGREAGRVMCVSVIGDDSRGCATNKYCMCGSCGVGHGVG